MLIKAKDCRLTHDIKGEYAIIRIKTNHWAVVEFVQDAYDVIARKLAEFDATRKLKLNFLE